MSCETVKGQGASESIYTHEEVSVLTRVFNNMLRNELDISNRIPMDPDNDDLFNTCSDGLVLIHILKLIDPTLVDMSKVCHGDNLNVF